MHRRSYVPFIIVSAALFLGGLALGFNRSDQDTSAANTASKILLTVGFLALLISTGIEIVSRLRARRAAQTTH